MGLWWQDWWWASIFWNVFVNVKTKQGYCKIRLLGWKRFVLTQLNESTVPVVSVQMQWLLTDLLDAALVLSSFVVRCSEMPNMHSYDLALRISLTLLWLLLQRPCRRISDWPHLVAADLDDVLHVSCSTMWQKQTVPVSSSRYLIHAKIDWYLLRQISDFAYVHIYIIYTYSYATLMDFYIYINICIYMHSLAHMPESFTFIYLYIYIYVYIWFHILTYRPVPESVRSTSFDLRRGHFDAPRYVDDGGRFGVPLSWCSVVHWCSPFGDFVAALFASVALRVATLVERKTSIRTGKQTVPVFSAMDCTASWALYWHILLQLFDISSTIAWVPFISLEPAKRGKM